MRLTIATLNVAVLAAMALPACTTPGQQRAAENAAVRKEAAQEVHRICSLPQPQRDTEIAQVKTQSGVVITCPMP